MAFSLPTTTPKMSIQALNWALAQDQIENSGARFVLLILCNYANETGECYPSRETIAKKTSTSVRSVQNHINWLSENGYITWKNEHTKANRQSPNLYQLPSAVFSLGNEKPSADSAKSRVQILQKPSAESAQNTSEETHQKESIECEIFKAWSFTLGNGKAICDEKRKKYIAARLKEGFTPEELKLVPLGVKNSPYHLGDNPTKTKYTGIETIYRDAGQVEKFLALAQTNGNGHSKGCDICRTHPLRSQLALKQDGWILDLEKGEVVPCECRINGTAQRQR